MSAAAAPPQRKRGAVIPGAAFPLPPAAVAASATTSDASTGAAAALTQSSDSASSAGPGRPLRQLYIEDDIGFTIKPSRRDMDDDDDDDDDDVDDEDEDDLQSVLSSDSSLRSSRISSKFSSKGGLKQKKRQQKPAPIIHVPKKVQALIRTLYPQLPPNEQQQLALLQATDMFEAGLLKAKKQAQDRESNNQEEKTKESPAAKKKLHSSVSLSREDLRLRLSSELLSTGAPDSQTFLLKRLRTFAEKSAYFSRKDAPPPSGEVSNMDGTARAWNQVEMSKSPHNKRGIKHSTLPMLVAPPSQYASPISSPRTARSLRQQTLVDLSHGGGGQHQYRIHALHAGGGSQSARIFRPPPPQPLPSVHASNNSGEGNEDETDDDAVLSISALLDTVKGAPTLLSTALGLSNLSLSPSLEMPITARDKLSSIYRNMPVVSDEYKWDHKSGRMVSKEGRLIRRGDQGHNKKSNSSQQRHLLNHKHSKKLLEHSSNDTATVPHGHTSANAVEETKSEEKQNESSAAAARDAKHASPPQPTTEQLYKHSLRLPVRVATGEDSNNNQETSSLLNVEHGEHDRFVNLSIEHLFDVEEIARVFAECREAQRTLALQQATSAAVAGGSSNPAAVSAILHPVGISSGGTANAASIANSSTASAGPSNQKESRTKDQYWSDFFDINKNMSSGNSSSPNVTSSSAQSAASSAESGPNLAAPNNAHQLAAEKSSKKGHPLTCHSAFGASAVDPLTKETFQLAASSDPDSSSNSPLSLSQLQSSLEQLFEFISEEKSRHQDIVKQLLLSVATPSSAANTGSISAAASPSHAHTNNAARGSLREARNSRLARQSQSSRNSDGSGLAGAKVITKVNLDAAIASGAHGVSVKSHAIRTRVNSVMERGDKGQMMLVQDVTHPSSNLSQTQRSSYDASNAALARLATLHTLVWKSLQILFHTSPLVLEEKERLKRENEASDRRRLALANAGIERAKRNLAPMSPSSASGRTSMASARGSTFRGSISRSSIISSRKRFSVLQTLNSDAISPTTNIAPWKANSKGILGLSSNVSSPSNAGGAGSLGIHAGAGGGGSGGNNGEAAASEVQAAVAHAQRESQLINERALRALEPVVLSKQQRRNFGDLVTRGFFLCQSVDGDYSLQWDPSQTVEAIKAELKQLA